jgi:hypothetical protein
VTDCCAAAARGAACLRAGRLALGFATFLTAFLAAFFAVGRAALRPALFLAVLALDFLAMSHSPSKVKVLAIPIPNAHERKS